MNHASITGRLGAVKFWPSKYQGRDPRIIMSILDVYRDKEGREKEMWWDAQFQSPRCKALAKFLRPGSIVTVVGQFYPIKFKSREGVLVERPIMKCHDVQFFSARDGRSKDDPRVRPLKDDDSWETAT